MRGVDGDTVASAELMVDELFANAVAHHEVQPGEKVGVVVRQVEWLSGAWIRVAVVDGGCGSVRLHRATDNQDSAIGGRGLRIVRCLGARISDELLPSGYLVAATFPAHLDTRERVCRCECMADRRNRWGVCQILADRTCSIPKTVMEELGGPVCRPCLQHLGALTSAVDPLVACALAEGAR